MTSISKEQYYLEYQKLLMIGEGAFGSVHKIMERKTRKLFALKLIYCQNLDELSQNLQELLLPLKIGDSKKPLVEVYHYLIDKTYVANKAPGGYLYQTEVYYLGIIMELGERNLYEDILIKIKEKKSYPKDDVQNLFLDLVDILASMQRENIAHRDIKPDNILVIKGSYKLTDFGLARKLKINRDNVYAGSPNYVSPKQRHAYDNNTYSMLDHDVFKSDVFSLGLTIFEMASLVNVEGMNTPEGRRSLQGYLASTRKMGILDSWCCDALERMLEFREDSRPDFLQLRGMLAPVYRARGIGEPLKPLGLPNPQAGKSKNNLSVMSVEETKKIEWKKENVKQGESYSVEGGSNKIYSSVTQCPSLNELISTKKKNPKVLETKNNKTRNQATLRKDTKNAEYKRVFSQKGSMSQASGIVLVEKLNILLQYGSNEIRFWTVGSNKLQESNQELRLDTDLLCMADCSEASKAPTTAVLFVGGKNGTLKLIAIREYKFDKVVKEKPEAHARAITCMLFLPKSKRLVTGSSDMTLKIWDFKEAEETLSYRSKLIGHSANITSLCTSDRRNQLFSGSVDNTIILWDVEGGSKIKTFSGHSDYITAMAFDKRNDFLYAACGKGKLYLWDTDQGTLEDSKEVNDSCWISCLGYNPERDQLFIPNGLNKILVNIGMETMNEIVLDQGAQQICSIISCEEFLLSSTFDGVISMFAPKLF